MCTHRTIYKKGLNCVFYDILIKRRCKLTEESIPYYAHFYSRNKLIVVFPHKVFNVTPDKETWKLAIKYGLSRGIPLEQLDFFHCKFEDETY